MENFPGIYRKSKTICNDRSYCKNPIYLNILSLIYDAYYVGDGQITITISAYLYVYYIIHISVLLFWRSTCARWDCSIVSQYTDQPQH